MPVQTSTILKAAVRWLQLRKDSSDSQIRALFRSHPKFSDITPTQYAAAYEWLESHGLLACPCAPTDVNRAVLEAAIREALWFPDADLLVPAPDTIPEDGMNAAEALNIAPDEAFAILRHSWGKVDTAERTRVGAAGELALVSLLQSVDNLRVHHLAAESDGFGYDIEVGTPTRIHHIEVKATTRRGRLAIYLSRNEFETMQRDRYWALVAVRLNESLEPVTVATVDRSWVSAATPNDRPGGRWESVRLEVPQHAISPGISSLLVPDDNLPPALRGIPPWPGS